MSFHGECDCCGRHDTELFRCWYAGIETFACAVCCQLEDDPDTKADARRNGDLPDLNERLGDG